MVAGEDQLENARVHCGLCRCECVCVHVSPTPMYVKKKRPRTWSCLRRLFLDILSQVLYLLWTFFFSQILATNYLKKKQFMEPWSTTLLFFIIWSEKWTFKGGYSSAVGRLHLLGIYDALGVIPSTSKSKVNLLIEYVKLVLQYKINEFQFW